jgi:GT2 family glycosyltransferase
MNISNLMSDIPSERIAAVVVTYNRVNFLEVLINSLRNQTHKLDSIIVVNNSSTDGTTEWLNEQRDLVIITQINQGSSGGQYTGIKSAYEKGFDWIWLVEDDILPNENCLELLLNNFDVMTIRAPLLLEKDMNPFYHFAVKYNLTNPFHSFWDSIIDENLVKQENFDAVGITFEGALINRKVVEKIGYPEKKFFIYADDTEYFIRASLANFKIIVVTSANCIRHFDYIESKTFTWKNYYIIRNIIAVSVLHGNIPVRIIRPFGFLISWLSKCRKFKDVLLTFKAFFHGYFYKSNN